MTIDEAIAHARENYNGIINTTYNKCQHEHFSCDGCANPTCKEIADENLQIAEWLEELQEIKSNGRYVQGNKAGQKIGYRNAIDDYNKELKEYLRRFTVHYVSDADFDYVAEQLKAGRSDE